MPFRLLYPRILQLPASENAREEAEKGGIFAAQLRTEVACDQAPLRLWFFSHLGVA